MGQSTGYIITLKSKPSFLTIFKGNDRVQLKHICLCQYCKGYFSVVTQSGITTKIKQKLQTKIRKKYLLKEKSSMIVVCFSLEKLLVFPSPVCATQILCLSLELLYKKTSRVPCICQKTQEDYWKNKLCFFGGSHPRLKDAKHVLALLITWKEATFIMILDDFLFNTKPCLCTLIAAVLSHHKDESTLALVPLILL